MWALLGILRQNLKGWDKMFRRIKPAHWMVVAVMVLLIAYSTNPSQEDFKYYISDGVKQEAQIKSSDTSSWLAGLLVDIAVKKGSDYFTRRQDFKFFSIYSMNLPGNKKEIKVLGLFGKFISLK